MNQQDLDREAVVRVLNSIMEIELAGVVRYTHYSLMIFGYNRLPIVEYLRAEALSSLTHAHQAGEMVTHLGAHPSLAIGPLLETHMHGVDEILGEALQNEGAALDLYKELLRLVEGRSVMLEEYARTMVNTEESHLGEVDKMLRKPGDIERFTSN